MRGIKGNRLPQEVQYRKSLLSIVGQLQSLVETEIIPVIRARETEFKTDGVLMDLSTILRATQQRVGDLESLGRNIATRMVTGVNTLQSARFRTLIRRATGVEIQNTISPRVSQHLEASVVKNVDLIETIPKQYFTKIQELIHTNVTEGRTGGSLIADIRGLNKSFEKRAKLIARDQTSKLVSQLNQERQQEAGIIGYRWRNVKDERVRGNPNGLYPKTKFDHWDREGKYFLYKEVKKPPLAPDGKPYNNPPADGPPGFPIQCRCVADPVIE